jgi:hypothetical protein
MAQIKNTDNSKRWWGYGASRTLNNASGRIKYSHFGKLFSCFNKVNICLLYGLEIPS